jgi:hypothetical protein
LGWCSSACKPPPFSSKHNNGHYGQTVLQSISDRIQRVRQTFVFTALITLVTSL